MDDLWKVVRSIPQGQVASYGDVGAALENPATGRMVGRWMANCPLDLPWWRVVDRSGGFPVGKRDPHLEMEQAEILRSEGVELVDNRVPMARFRASLD